MPGPVNEYLTRDHERLDELLGRCALGEELDMAAYEEFRAGLLRHIAMEEKVLLPEARRRRGGEPLEAAGQLRADHAALAALLIPTPSRDILETIASVLESHNPLEEGPDGVYAACEQLAGDSADDLLDRLVAVPDVKVAAHLDEPRIHAHIARLLEARISAVVR